MLSCFVSTRVFARAVKTNIFIASTFRSRIDAANSTEQGHDTSTKGRPSWPQKKEA